MAVVGTGPAGFYAAAALLANKGVEVTIFDRLLTSYGLVRAGVAPDHPETKSVAEVFRSTTTRKALRVELGVHVGTDVTHEELLAHHHAGIYAVGAPRDRRMNIPGEDLPGSHSATEFVGWYNGHPDFADRVFDLSGDRAVVVGNGNVALDIARILLTDAERLERETDIASHALDMLRHSNIREVVVAARRGRAQAAYTAPELLALIQNADIDVVVDSAGLAHDPVADLLERADTEPHVRVKVRLACELAAAGERTGRRIVLMFLSSPAEVFGAGVAERIRFERTHLDRAPDGTVRTAVTAETDDVAAGLIIRSIGYTGSPVAGLPFDEVAAVIPNTEGRVFDPDAGKIVPGAYVSGWAKRGPNGVIGTNRRCSAETAACLLEDYRAGLLRDPAGSADSLESLLAERVPDHLGITDWYRVDKAERDAGSAQGRPRQKLVREQQIRHATCG